MDIQLNSRGQILREPLIKTNRASCPPIQILMILFLLPLFCNSTCPAAVTGTSSIYSKQDSFTLYSPTITYGVVIGKTSGIEYYMYKVTTNYDKTVIQKIDSFEATNTAAYSIKPIEKSLYLDPSGFDSFLYFAGLYNPLAVIKVNGVTLGIEDQKIHSGIQGERDDIQIHYKSDNTGYYIVACGGTNAIVCYYKLSSTSEECQVIPNINQYAFGQLKLADNSLFFLGADPAHQFSLHFYNIAYESSSLFNTKWSCSYPATPAVTSALTVYSSQSIFVSPLIFCFFTFSMPGSSFRILYLASFTLPGVPNLKYKSNISCDSVNGAATNGNVIIATVLCYSPAASYNLIVYDTTANSVTIKGFTGTGINGCGIDLASRFIVTGAMNPNGYTTKFGISELNQHPDFTLTSPLSLSPTSESITLDTSSLQISSPSNTFYFSPTPVYSQISDPTYICCFI